MSSWKTQILRSLLACLAFLSLGSGPADAGDVATATRVEAPGSDAGVANSADLSPAKPDGEPDARAEKNWLHTGMNLGAIAFLMWMVALMFRPGLGPSLSKPEDP